MPTSVTLTSTRSTRRYWTAQTQAVSSSHDAPPSSWSRSARPPTPSVRAETMKPKVAFIGTGGTIASLGVGPLDLQNYGATGNVMHADEIIARWPETALVADVLPVRYRNIPSTAIDRKSTRLNSSHVRTSYAVFCLKKKNERERRERHILRQKDVELRQLVGIDVRAVRRERQLDTGVAEASQLFFF